MHLGGGRNIVCVLPNLDIFVFRASSSGTRQREGARAREFWVPGIYTPGLHRVAHLGTWVQSAVYWSFAKQVGVLYRGLMERMCVYAPRQQRTGSGACGSEQKRHGLSPTPAPVDVRGGSNVGAAIQGRWWPREQTLLKRGTGAGTGMGAWNRRPNRPPLGTPASCPRGPKARSWSRQQPSTKHHGYSVVMVAALTPTWRCRRAWQAASRSGLESWWRPSSWAIVLPINTQCFRWKI